MHIGASLAAPPLHETWLFAKGRAYQTTSVQGL